jgi:thiol-disulfide isomerase/thioredoxin
MNRIPVGCFIVLIMVLSLQCSGPYRTEKDGDQTIYVGKVDRLLFEKSDLSWFREEYQRYSPQSTILDSIRGKTDSLNAIVFLGTWCHDTHRELPRFLKIIETENIPIRILELHALNLKKQSGDVLPVVFDIRYIPTFIFFKNGKEVGRIVEIPKMSLEADIVGMFMEVK